MVTAVVAQAPGLAAQSAAHPARPGLMEHCAMLTVAAQAPGVAAHRAVQPGIAGLMMHWPMVAVPPVQIGSLGLLEHEASKGAQPARSGVAVHWA